MCQLNGFGATESQAKVSLDACFIVEANPTSDLLTLNNLLKTNHHHQQRTTNHRLGKRDNKEHWFDFKSE